MKYSLPLLPADGEVQYLHPKDGVYPEKVNAGRQAVGSVDRRIGANPNPIEVTSCALLMVPCLLSLCSPCGYQAACILSNVFAWFAVGVLVPQRPAPAWLMQLNCPPSLLQVKFTGKMGTYDV